MSTWKKIATTDEIIDSAEGTAVLSTGVSENPQKFLKADGDGTCSWQSPAIGISALNDGPDITQTEGTGAGETSWPIASWRAQLTDSGVSAGTYNRATITVDAKGRITSASSGTFQAMDLGSNQSSDGSGNNHLAGSILSADGNGGTDWSGGIGYSQFIKSSSDGSISIGDSNNVNNFIITKVTTDVLDSNGDDGTGTTSEYSIMESDGDGGVRWINGVGFNSLLKTSLGGTIAITEGSNNIINFEATLDLDELQDVSFSSGTVSLTQDTNMQSIQLGRTADFDGSNSGNQTGQIGQIKFVFNDTNAGNGYTGQGTAGYILCRHDDTPTGDGSDPASNVASTRLTFGTVDDSFSTTEHMILASTGNLHVNGFVVDGGVDPTQINHLTNKSYVDKQLSSSTEDIVINHGANKDILIKENGTLGATIGTFGDGGVTNGYGYKIYANGDENEDFFMSLSCNPTTGTKFGTFDTNTNDSNSFEIETQGNIMLDASHDITLDAGGGNIHLLDDTGTFTPTAATHATTKAYVDGENLQSPGTIIGYTNIWRDGGSASQQTTTTLTAINFSAATWDSGDDHYLGVSFKVPNTEMILIEAYLPSTTGMDGNVSLGLMEYDNGSFTALDTDEHTFKCWDVDETDYVQLRVTWVVDASDFSWSSGDTVKLYIGIQEQYSGGRTFVGTSNFGPNYGAAQCCAYILPSNISSGMQVS